VGTRYRLRDPAAARQDADPACEFRTIDPLTPESTEPVRPRTPAARASSTPLDDTRKKSGPVKVRFLLARASAVKRRKEGRKDMTLKRMDNVLIVVDDLEAVKAFFIELGLKLEGETTVEGPSVGSLIGLTDVQATLAMMRTPDGQGIELDKFHTPNAIRFGPVNAPMNTLGIRRVMFAVDDIDPLVARMRAHGAALIGEMEYEDTYRLAYIRGPEGIIVALAEKLG
jgi:catechol 2,3-dioxygenase-like lactoylglutathione lyase family enzyme